jgi:hypothetical protein
MATKGWREEIVQTDSAGRLAPAVKSAAAQQHARRGARNEGSVQQWSRGCATTSTMTDASTEMCDRCVPAPALEAQPVRVWRQHGRPRYAAPPARVPLQQRLTGVGVRYWLSIADVNERETDPSAVSAGERTSKLVSLIGFGSSSAQPACAQRARSSSLHDAVSACTRDSENSSQRRRYRLLLLRCAHTAAHASCAPPRARRGACRAS